MSDLATLERDYVSQPPLPAKRERLSPRMRKVVDLLVTGECKTQKAACERVGMHPDHVCRELKKPQYQAFASRRAREFLRHGVMRASAKLIELMDAKSEATAFDATRLTLALDGIKPAESGTSVSVNLITPGYAVDLTPVTVEGRIVGSKADE